MPVRPTGRPAPTKYAMSAPSRTIPLPPVLPARLPFQMASESQRMMPSGRGFHLIAPAMAEPVIGHRSGSSTGNWAIQVGAFASSNLAAAAAAAARATKREATSPAPAAASRKFGRAGQPCIAPDFRDSRMKGPPRPASASAPAAHELHGRLARRTELTLNASNP